MADTLTAKDIFEIYAAVPPAQRQFSVWVMNQETLDQIKELPEAERFGYPIAGNPSLLFGKPIRVEPDAVGIQLVHADHPNERKPKRISAQTFLHALADAGIILQGDYVRRVVIDAKVERAVVVHVERYGDERLLKVVRTLDGVEVREEARGDDD